jgi:hypothetical protein
MANMAPVIHVARGIRKRHDPSRDLVGGGDTTERNLGAKLQRP